MEVGDLHKMWEIRALKRKPEEPTAHALLDRVAKKVQPSCAAASGASRSSPSSQPEAAGAQRQLRHRGEAVKLRLWRDGRDLDFIPYEEVLDTMLHKIAHNARRPHNAQFYKLWDELRKFDSTTDGAVKYEIPIVAVHCKITI
ncbi:DNA-dependent metalloprotease WSS1-like [Triticum dicoccoides]|uniref:DNA-dependent metalloprotease WSS1-like n=1 Tax=Triticum dicoccoides TaxID=85692 RepID=UPI0008423E6B|nr:DNA-dependent metalloprotease WSS1-like [Triticum dicoccoides]XP_037433463.1 DNA-dependent metalloprotease WSS1-like [Triticum dicoccoides]XP_044380073.1 DNA-dependent metalloprotease WSS1-like [Triticum aestivum]XP_044380074.1 DNA-dependent metalloprotease WSS1-like [Triticum aestivum]XP_044380075.1 DNA-dependent metalloprotease WSS1-like [Triticum aestivum]